MTAIICWLPAALLQRQELIAEIDKGRVFVLAAEREVEQPSIKRQRFVDLADLKRQVVKADRTCFLCARHDGLLAVEATSSFEVQLTPRTSGMRSPNGSPVALS